MLSRLTHILYPTVTHYVCKFRFMRIFVVTALFQLKRLFASFFLVLWISLCTAYLEIRRDSFYTLKNHSAHPYIQEKNERVIYNIKLYSYCEETKMALLSFLLVCRCSEKISFSFSRDCRLAWSLHSFITGFHIIHWAVVVVPVLLVLQFAMHFSLLNKETERKCDLRGGKRKRSWK